jgi:RraA family protein
MTVLRIHRLPRPPREDLVKRLSALSTAVVSDQMGRSGALVRVRPLSQEMTLAGPALTVSTRLGDNLAIHKAIDMARPGDILVVDGGGHRDRALVGELVCRYARSRGVAGMVLYGAVRDSAAIATGSLPVFACGATPLGPHRTGPGEVGGPVAIGASVVHAGDLVVGDLDGVVVVPARLAADVVARGERDVLNEEQLRAAAEDGALDRSWIEATAIETVN